ncbi:MAG: BolA family transcriptional regulator [Gallionellaceae bacterium]|nr:BolA family transcriptional regulator [Gallionellaceae bacterium]MDD5367149.1 BolA family transcriptional regulator [Gallionellaceae bacterium]
MTTPQQIKDWLEAALPCEHVQVEGDGQHFDAVIVSAEFRGKTRVGQHQVVYQALGNHMDSDIHALSMKTLTPEEWQHG